MKDYTDVRYEDILRTAAISLQEEGRHNQADILKDSAACIIALREQVRAAESLLKEALDLLDGTYEHCDEVGSQEWVWKMSVREVLKGGGNA